MVIELCWAFVALEISSCLVIAKNLIFQPLGAIIVALSTQAVKETSAQALYTFFG